MSNLFILVLASLMTYQAIASDQLCEESQEIDLALAVNGDHRCKKVFEKYIETQNHREEHFNRWALRTIPTVVPPIILAAKAHRASKNASQLAYINSALNYANLSSEEIFQQNLKAQMPTILRARKRRLDQINKGRSELGMALMSQAEYDQYEPLATGPSAKITTQHQSIMSLTWRINMWAKGSSPDVTYDEVKAYLISVRDTDKLCKDGSIPRLNKKYFTYLAQEIKRFKALGIQK